jgi:[methyl-Co(III) methanol-specific corrinoid protein]:coenzyme M methyltransferase
MSAAVSEVMTAVGRDFRLVHHDAEIMAGTAIAIARESGFENIGLPLCATVEADAFGSSIAPATAVFEPRVSRERYSDIDEALELDIEVALNSPRIATLLEAVAIASEESEGLPVIANVLGPVTLAGSLLEPTVLLRAMHDAPEKCDQLLSKLDQFLCTLSGRLVLMGADVIAIHEDVGTPRAIGPRLFERFTTAHLSVLISGLRGGNAPVAVAGHLPFCVCPACRMTTAMAGMCREIPVVVHCCELSRATWHLLAGVGANAWSVGHGTVIRQLRAAQPELVLIGNACTKVLDQGSVADAGRLALHCVSSGVNILSPACGLAMSTPLANIRRFADGAQISDVTQEAGPENFMGEAF